MRTADASDARKGSLPLNVARRPAGPWRTCTVGWRAWSPRLTSGWLTAGPCTPTTSVRTGSPVALVPRAHRSRCSGCHGSPNIGSPPEPLFAAAEANGLRWVSYDRPGYGGSGPHDGRTVASAAADVAAIADALGIGQFAVLGHSGGGPHALACAALLPERVIAAVSVSAPAPVDADGLEWFAGWSPGNAAENRARGGRARGAGGALGRRRARGHGRLLHRGRHGCSRRQLVMAGRCGWPGHTSRVTRDILQDTLASVQPWEFGLDAIGVPVLIMHGVKDKMVPVRAR